MGGSRAPSPLSVRLGSGVFESSFPVGSPRKLRKSGADGMPSYVGPSAVAAGRGVLSAGAPTAWVPESENGARLLPIRRRHRPTRADARRAQTDEAEVAAFPFTVEDTRALTPGALAGNQPAA